MFEDNYVTNMEDDVLQGPDLTMQPFEVKSITDLFDQKS